jgi:hypothetical protein
MDVRAREISRVSRSMVAVSGAADLIVDRCVDARR